MSQIFTYPYARDTSRSHTYRAEARTRNMYIFAVQITRSHTIGLLLLYANCPDPFAENGTN